MKTKTLLLEDKLRIDRALDRLLPKSGQLARAMRYSVFAGGKKFRPILCLATARALRVSEQKVLAFACAVEMVHTFTLIHDDLPAMDDSDYRRGKLTSHKRFGEGVAILAGDALNTLAFKIIANYPLAAFELADSLLKVVEGQVSDIGAAGKKISLRQLRSIHDWKTAALLRACVRGSARICGASRGEIDHLTKYADHLGLAFQIADDILDCVATRRQLGKPVKADRGKGFPFYLGLPRSRAWAEREKEKALQAVSSMGRSADQLRALAEFVVERKY